MRMRGQKIKCSSDDERSCVLPHREEAGVEPRESWTEMMTVGDNESQH